MSALARVLALACLIGLCAGARAAPAVLVIDQAIAVQSDAERLAEVRGEPRLQALPDDWAQSRPGYEGTVWYRVRFDIAPGGEPRELLALYVARVCTNFEVHLNGQAIFSGGSMREPVSRLCYQPQLVTLPTALLQPGANRIDIRVRGHALQHVASTQRAAGLSALQLGALRELGATWRAEQWRTYTAVQLAGVTMVVLGVFMLGVGWFNRRASHVMYFGALAVAWSALTARVWIVDAPWSNATVEFLVGLGVAPVAGLTVVFLLRYAGLKHRALDLALLAQCAVLPLSVVLAGAGRFNGALRLWFALLGLQMAAAFAVYLHASWRQRRTEAWVMGGMLALLALLAGIEWALHRADALSVWRGYTVRFALPALMLVVSFRLVQVFARALRTAEAGRSSLEARIQEAAAEIERNFAQLAELRVEQVTEKERKRIAADLHDDLGAKLLTIVHTSDSEHISSLAREALEEMRLSVRGLTGKPVRAADALADWRAETVSRLGQAGIEADWAGPPEDFDRPMSARAFVQTTRILREAVSNIIKHSGASRCTVRCTIDEREIGLVVQDNGRGIPLELDGRLDRGHGMSSMKHRAKQMHGQCLVESGPGYGTVIRLTLPL